MLHPSPISSSCNLSCRSGPRYLLYRNWYACAPTVTSLYAAALVLSVPCLLPIDANEEPCTPRPALALALLMTQSNGSIQNSLMAGRAFRFPTALGWALFTLASAFRVTQLSGRGTDGRESIRFVSRHGSPTRFVRNTSSTAYLARLPSPGRRRGNFTQGGCYLARQGQAYSSRGPEYEARLF